MTKKNKWNSSLFIIAFFLLSVNSNYAQENNKPFSKQNGTLNDFPIRIQLPEVNFTDPVLIYQHSQYSYTIINRFMDLLRSVPSGESVYMSMFLFSYPDAINAIKEADNKGVVIHLLVDSSRAESIKANQHAYEVFSTLKNATYATVANDITFGNDNTNGINHNKFAIFSKIHTVNGPIKNVVFQTSNNFTNTQCSYFQDNVILQDDNLFQCYLNVWNDIYARAKKGMKTISFREYHDKKNNIHGYFFPKLKNGKEFGNDPILDLLDEVTNPEQDTIKVLMATWTASRSNILDKLEDLRSKGAHIEIATSADGAKGLIPKLLEIKQKGAIVRIFNTPKQEKLKKNVHSKYLLVKGYINKRKGTLLATGSENYTFPALRCNNETLLTFLNSSFFSQYENNFDTILHM